MANLTNEVLTFEDWMALVDYRCKKWYKKSVYDLPGRDYAKLYNEGWAVEVAARLAQQARAA